jgi:flagellar hook-associated protein 2
VAISSPGVGSNLDVNGIIKQLMTVEAQPLTTLAKKEASYQAKLTAFGSLSGALSSFQSSLAGLSNPGKFQSVTATPGDSTILKGTAASQAVAGSYNINVTQLAQAQTITSAGQTSPVATIGSGASTTLTFQFGTIAGGNFISTGNKLNSSVATGGIAANSLSINGTTITTSSTTTSANSLAAQINLATGTTGVTATALGTDTGTLGTFTTTSGAATYRLDVGGVNIVNNAAIGTTAANIDTAVGAAAANLTAAGISFTGTAAAGTLKFTNTNGANIAIQESGAGSVGGFSTSIGIGTTKNFTSSVSLSSANAVTIGGTNPAAAGFSAGILTTGVYSGASFTQDPNQTSGTVTIDNTNNSLQGIRDAINKANIGVTASIIADGSATPNHLVLTSNKTGLTSSMKISVAGDAAVSGLLAYDPAGVQKMTQTSAAQSSALTVNGVAVTGATNTVSEAIQDVTLNLSKIGSTTLSVARDNSAVTTSVNAFVRAYNDINKTLKDLTAFNPQTKESGILIGDATVRSVQTGIRQMLSAPVSDAGSLKTLSDVGITFQKDGTLALDSSKLQNAITNNFKDIGALFAAMGTTTDSLASFVTSTSATKPGKYALNLTALATQGKVVGSTAPGLTITAGTNDKLTMTVDGVTATATLVAGTYTVNSLINHVQSAINGAPELSAAGIAVKVTANGSNILSITSNRYGSASKVTAAGNGAANLLGVAQTSTDGIDVAGTINGATASGSGQSLTGGAGTAADGLKLLITGGTTGDRGTISFSQGYAFQLSKLVDSYLGSKGLIPGRTNGIDSSIKDVRKQQDNFNVKLTAMEKRYRAQFTALDVAIGNMNKTSSFLTQQLASLSKSQP